MTARRVTAVLAASLLAAGVWVYIEQLRYERSFYRRYQLERT